MARHAQPRELAELKGAVKHDPQRYKGEAIKSEQPLGTAPEHLSEHAKAVWFEIEAHSLPGVLTGADRFVMEIASTLLAEYRIDPAEFAVGKYTHLVGILARLGLSPSDRQKFTKDSGSKGNEFDDF